MYLVMIKRAFFLDTCIWRDFYENRFSKTGNPLGKYATSLFMKILNNRDTILFSKALVWELRKDYSENDINDMLNLLVLNKILINLEITKEEHLESKHLSQERNLPYIDCLNAVQARNNDAVLVTQDAHFFEKLTDIIKPIRPQEII